jgi:hypothetical protein
VTNPGASPRPGPHNPVSGTPPRAPASVRRTTTIDTTFPDGLGGRVVIHVRGRDLHTGVTGETTVLEELAVDLEVDAWAATIVRVDAVASSAPLDALEGLPFRGLRRRLRELLPEHAARRSLCFSALEDLAGAYLVSGYAGLRAGLIETSPEVAELAVQTQGDICIGWALDGPVIGTLRATANHAVPFGPTAPSLDGEDPLAWHDAPPLSTLSVRRRRRTDVPAPESNNGLRIEHHFRDSYADVDAEQVMHEYLVGAVFDDARRLVSVDVDARVLPWYECPGATVTAQRLVGVAVDEIDARAVSELTGVTTCTHLNSTLRTLADVRALDRSAQ